MKHNDEKNQGKPKPCDCFGKTCIVFLVGHGGLLDVKEQFGPLILGLLDYKLTRPDFNGALYPQVFY